MKPIERQINEAIKKLEQEVRTFVEVSGVKGVSESESVYWSPFTGPTNEAAVAAVEKARRAVTKLGAIPEVLRILEPLLGEARAGRLRIDKTHSVEEENERILQRRKEQEARDDGNRKRQEAGEKMLAKAPPWAKALIVAEFHEDTSDPMTDYFGSNRTRMALIGWRSGKKDDFNQYRAAAANYPELAFLADCKYEHREKWSMGHGYYLAVSKYHGWQVRALWMKAVYEYDFEDWTPEPAAQRNVTNAFVRENIDKDGVEIIFPSKPEEDVLTRLKSNGFRWNGRDKLWYARRTPQRIDFANELAGQWAARKTG